MTNRGGFLILAYFTMSLSGSMFAQANFSELRFGPIITIDLPRARTVPSKGKFESVNVCLRRPRSKKNYICF